MSSESHEFQPELLTLARERRGLTKAELADRCGVTRRAVSDWEAGRVLAPPVAVISEILQFPKQFFFADEIVAVTADEVSFRALTSLSARQLKASLARASMVARFSQWLDDKYSTPPLDVPAIDDLLVPLSDGDPDPQQAAELLRRIWGLGDFPIPDLLALVESKGIRVFALADDAREVDAFSLWLHGRPSIFVNLSKSSERVRFDIAHELGHLTMHRGVVTNRIRSFETSANDFAGCFLVPSSKLMALASSRLTFDNVFKLKKYFRISATALVVRLHQLNIINNWQYRNWMIDLSQRGFRSSEPDGIEYEQSHLLTAVLKLAREDGYSLRRIAGELGLPSNELHGALRGLTLIPAA